MKEKILNEFDEKYEVIMTEADIGGVTDSCIVGKNKETDKYGYYKNTCGLSDIKSFLSSTIERLLLKKGAVKKILDGHVCSCSMGTYHLDYLADTKKLAKDINALQKEKPNDRD